MVTIEKNDTQWKKKDRWRKWGEWEEGDLLRAAMWCLKQEAGETTEEALFHRHNEGNATMGVMPRACLHYTEQCMQD